jgi:hypothetical protein
MPSRFPSGILDCRDSQVALWERRADDGAAAGRELAEGLIDRAGLYVGEVIRVPSEGQAADEVTEHVAGTVIENGRVLVSDASGWSRAVDGCRAGRVRCRDVQVGHAERPGGLRRRRSSLC